jgi:peroxiredoxin
MLKAGDRAPSFTLADAATGEPVTDPWKGGATLLAFFKTTCPVCHMVAPKLTALRQAGARVIGIGEDPPARLANYLSERGQDIPTLTEPAPYAVSDAYGLTSVPTVFVVAEDGTITHAAGGWDRERWNEAAEALGAGRISDPSDGLPAFRPG